MATESVKFDLLLKGGTLLDPSQSIYDKRDVAFREGKVAAVEASIENTSALRTIDITDRLITPGLIDLHGHFYHGGTGSAVHADQNCLSESMSEDS